MKLHLAGGRDRCLGCKTDGWDLHGLMRVATIIKDWLMAGGVRRATIRINDRFVENVGFRATKGDYLLLLCLKKLRDTRAKAEKHLVGRKTND